MGTFGNDICTSILGFYAIYTLVENRFNYTSIIPWSEHYVILSLKQVFLFRVISNLQSSRGNSKRWETPFT